MSDKQTVYDIRNDVVFEATGAIARHTELPVDAQVDLLDDLRESTQEILEQHLCERGTESNHE